MGVSLLRLALEEGGAFRTKFAWPGAGRPLGPAQTRGPHEDVCIGGAGGGHSRAMEVSEAEAPGTGEPAAGPGGAPAWACGAGGWELSQAGLQCGLWQNLGVLWGRTVWDR